MLSQLSHAFLGHIRIIIRAYNHSSIRPLWPAQYSKCCQSYLCPQESRTAQVAVMLGRQAGSSLPGSAAVMLFALLSAHLTRLRHGIRSERNHSISTWETGSHLYRSPGPDPDGGGQLQGPPCIAACTSTPR